MTSNISKSALSLFVLTTIILFGSIINAKNENVKKEEILRKFEIQEDSKIHDQKLFFDNNTTLFCSYYAKCLDILEEKHRECLMHSKEKHKHHLKKNSNKCELAKKSSQKMLSGYILRQIEITKDCVNKNILESTSMSMNVKKKDKCHRIIENYLIYDKVKTFKNYSEDKENSDKTKAKVKKSFRQLRRCNKTKKFWQKQCHILSKCCSISKKCEKGNAMLMEIKLTKERKNLNNISCNDEK